MQTCKRTSIPAYQHANMQTCKPITMVIYIAGSIPLFKGKRSNHFRLQRQSKHGASRRLKGQAAAPFPDKSSSRFAASVFIGKTLYPTAPCKRAFENGNDRPATDRKGKIIRKAGLERTGLWQAHFGTFGTVGKAGTASADSRHEAWSREDTDRPQTRRRVFTEKIP